MKSMRSATSAKKRAFTAPPTASRARVLRLSVPSELRARLAVQAAKRNLEPAAAARVFLDEHVRELEETETLSRAEEWQRAQAWATWEKIQAGDHEDVPMDRFREHTARALAEIDEIAGRR
jgi:hypothetical protein